MSTIQPPDNPIALHRSHLLSPAPDRLTNTPTTLRITRENTLSGRDFSIHQIRNYEDIPSPRHSILLYTVAGRLWSSSQHREIRDATGRPLLELRRLWWRGLWTVKRAGTEDDILSADQGWGMRGKMGVRFENALMSSGQRGRRATVSASVSHPRREDDPPSYNEAVRENLSSNHRRGRTSTESGSSLDEIPVGKRDCDLPSYDSVRRSSNHSLRDLLDAIEPPAEPAPATASSLSAVRSMSSAGTAASAKVELKVLQQSRTTAAVMMGRKMIIYIRQEKFLDFNLSGSMTLWEVEVAEGVDLLLAVCIVLMIAEYVKHEYRLPTS